MKIVREHINEAGIFPIKSVLSEIPGLDLKKLDELMPDIYANARPLAVISNLDDPYQYDYTILCVVDSIYVINMLVVFYYEKLQIKTRLDWDYPQNSLFKDHKIFKDLDNK